MALIATAIENGIKMGRLTSGVFPLDPHWAFRKGFHALVPTMP